MRCACNRVHAPVFIALTGGPGAGKTAVLEVVRRHFCEHVVVLPEAATILFSGGFPRRGDLPARKAAQRAIFRVQCELEAMVRDERRACVVLCDRGTLDGAAFWPASSSSYFAEVGTTVERELARYARVIHLRTPDALRYDHVNPVRTETPEQARACDLRILAAWSGHPRRTIVEATVDFVAKLTTTLTLIDGEIPACCRPHAHEVACAP